MTPSTSAPHRAPTTAATTAATSLPTTAGGVALAQVRSAVTDLAQDGRHAEAMEYALAALAAVLQKSSELELLLAKLRAAGLGKRSERTNAEQLALLLDELLKQAPQPELDPDTEAREDAALTAEIARADAASPTARRARPSWRTSEAVDREIHIHDVPASAQQCGTCGRAMRGIGHDERQILAYVPARFVVHEHQLQKYACGTCKDGVTTAAGPSTALEHRSADASLLAHVVVSKFGDHTPLTRLAGIYARSGVTIAVSTMADWVAAVADQVAPIVDALTARVQRAHVIGTDATGLKVLDPTSANNVEYGTIWCYVGDDRDVVYTYAPTGAGATGPWTFLQRRTGYVQADAASVFDRLYTGEAATAVEVGCWAHARRRLVELQPTDCRVAYPLQLIARLYRIEHLADAQQLAPSDRAALRRERSLPMLEKLKNALARAHVHEPPGSAFANATRYVLNHWTALTRFVDDGRLLLDNNGTERQLRAVALGRKNYLFAGSHDAARRAAVLYSLLRTCAQHGVPPLPYLTDVLRKLRDDVPATDLLPDRWHDVYGARDPQ